MTGTGIVVTDLHHIEGEGSLRAFFSVALGGVTIHNCRLIEGVRGMFVGWPARKPQGSDRWQAIVVVTESIASRVLAAALAAYEAPAP